MAWLDSSGLDLVQLQLGSDWSLNSKGPVQPGAASCLSLSILSACGHFVGLVWASSKRGSLRFPTRQLIDSKPSVPRGARWRICHLF